jgi:methylmalonyl-CoA mutase
MKILFDSIPLDKVSVSMTMNGAVLPVLAFYIVAALEQGATLDQLAGTIQNDILKEYMVRNTYIYPPTPSMKIIADIFEFTSQKMPKFNSSPSPAITCRKPAPPPTSNWPTPSPTARIPPHRHRRGIDIDAFAPRLSFFWAQGKNHFMEVAKMRAARMLWAKIVKTFNPKNPKSLALRTHSQTSGWSLTEQDPFNNIARTCIEAMAATLGHTQSLHTNALDEAIALPTDFSARIARNTQLFLQDETAICRVIDPGAAPTTSKPSPTSSCTAPGPHHGSRGTRRHVQGHRAGIPKMRIEEAAARRQARIDSGEETIVGVNKYRLAKEDPLDILDVDNTAVRDFPDRAPRNSAPSATKPPARPLSPPSPIAPAAARATCSNSPSRPPRPALARRDLRRLENTSAATRPSSAHLRRLLGKEFSNQGDMKDIPDLIARFEAAEGRRPRIMVAKMGQDGHDRGAKVVSTAYADMGFDVDIGPLFQTPAETAKQAVENDVHVVAMSSLAAGHKTLLPAHRRTQAPRPRGHHGRLRRRHPRPGLRLSSIKTAPPPSSAPAPSPHLRPRPRQGRRPPSPPKSVINGRDTMFFNILPLKYQWAYDLYKTMKNNHWEPEDIPMQKDVEQWRDDEISDVERWIIKMGIGYFSAAEGIVGDNILHVVRELVTAPELKLVLGRHAHEENIHADSLVYMISSLGINPHECEAMFEDIPTIKAQERLRRLQHLAGPAPRHRPHRHREQEALAKNIFVFGQCMEGTQFYGLFGMILSLYRQNKFPGIGQMFRYTLRDESNHIEVFRNLLMDLVDENPDIWTEDFKEDLRATMRRGHRPRKGIHPRLPPRRRRRPQLRRFRDLHRLHRRPPPHRLRPRSAQPASATPSPGSPR